MATQHHSLLTETVVRDFGALGILSFNFTHGYSRVVGHEGVLDGLGDELPRHGLGGKLESFGSVVARGRGHLPRRRP